MLPRNSMSRLALLSILLAAISVTACGGTTIGATTPLPTPSPTRLPGSLTAASGSPTATPLSTISLQTPVLGGSWKAFATLFDNNQGCPNAWAYQTPLGSTCIDLIWPEKSIPEPDDPNTRVTGIDVNPHNTWNMTQEQQALTQFMPPDATLVSTKTVYDAANIAVGVEKTYTSVLLANTLPKADFVDVTGKQVQPGMFYMYLDRGLVRGENNALGTDERFVQTAY